MRKTWFECNVGWIKFVMWGAFGAVVGHNTEGWKSFLAVVVVAAIASCLNCLDMSLKLDSAAQQKIED